MTRKEHEIRKEIKALDERLVDTIGDELDKVRARLQALWFELLATRKASTVKAN